MYTIKIITPNNQEKIEDAYYVRDVVFTQEQGFAAELDIDEYDPISTHAVIYSEQKPIGTARLIPYKEGGKIGRVAIIKEHRGKNLGTQLMNAILHEARQLKYPIVMLSSQTHAQKFYEKLGFVAEGEPYLEEGAPHIFMVKSLVS